ncbi:MAG: FecR domain-containing protein [Gemmatimonadota bacterium]|nr:FecR domain-containing protein [Gemmatimonadota bacterium]
MSTSVPPRDGGVSTPPPRTALADEEALRRVFLSEFPALAAEARTDLGPDAAVLSTKVVEGAFVRAWDARAQLATPEALHKFLVDDVHHAAARALSRRAAAHRLGGDAAHTAHTTAETTPDQSWAHIQHALHGEAHSPQALAEAAAISRHEAAEHIVGVTREKPLWAILAVGAVVLAALIGVVLWIDHLDADAKIARAVNAADSRVVSSVPAQVGIVSLDDGSKVRLAPESKLTIPKNFGPELRAVKLEGAASFEVAPGQSKEFRVLARNAAVVAKGTKFTVRAYPNDPAVSVVVDEGSVEIRRANEETPLAAGAALVIPDSGATRPASPDERVEADGWRKGTLAITKQPLREVLPQLKRWYGLNIMVQQPKLLERPVSMVVSLDSSRAAIRAVEASTGLEFGYIGQTMVFKERVAKAAKPATKQKAKPKAKAARRR